jgi:hypothetical protein
MCTNNLNGGNQLLKLLGIVLTLALALTGCNQADTTKQQIGDNTTNNVSYVSDKTNNGKAVGQEYGGKGTGYGQVKKIESGQAVPPLIEAPELTLDEKVASFAANTLPEGFITVTLAETATHYIFYICYDNAVTSLSDMQVFTSPDKATELAAITGTTFDKMGVGNVGVVQGFYDNKDTNLATFIMKKQ